MSQSAFIPTAVDPPKRGRGATPRRIPAIALDKPNPVGNRKLKYVYRPLKRWSAWHVEVIEGAAAVAVESDSNLDLAERGLAYYFAMVGGFRLADDAVVRLFYDALAYFSDHAAELQVRPTTLMKWAIDAKAESLRAETPEERAFKRNFIPRPDNFLKPGSLDGWLDKSEQRAAHRRKLAGARHDAELQQQSQEYFARLPADGPPDNKERQRPRHVADAREERLLAFYFSLPRDRQFRALHGVEPAWKRQCTKNGEDPRSQTMQDLLRIQAARWACDAWPAATASPSKDAEQ